MTYSTHLWKNMGQYMKECRASASTGWLLFQAHMNQHSQQHKESDHHTDQHTIYKISQGNQCPTLRQADASAEFADSRKSILIQAHNFIINAPSIKWKHWGEVKATKSLLQKPKADTYNIHIVLHSYFYSQVRHPLQSCWHIECGECIRDIDVLVYCLYVLLQGSELS